MTRKKIVLFIVEGINDKTCLEGVLENVVDSEEVRFQMTDGDITTRYDIDEYKIRNEIGKIVKAFKDKYHLKPEHFMEVIHIIDTDGLYLKEDCIHPADVEKTLYMDDGIYTKDPKKYEDAEKIDEITYLEVLNKKLNVMDTTATSLCMDNDIPIIVFNINEKGNLKRVIDGEKIGTTVESKQ